MILFLLLLFAAAVVVVVLCKGSIVHTCTDARGGDALSSDVLRPGLPSKYTKMDLSMLLLLLLFPGNRQENNGKSTNFFYSLF